MLNNRRSHRSRWGRLSRASATVLAATCLLASCGDSGDSETSDSDTTLTVYSGRNEGLVGDLITQFTAETGIKVDLRTGGSGELSAQILTEGDNSPADIFFSQDAGALGALSKEGLLAEVPEATRDLVDPRFRATDDTWIGTSARARVFVYNPNLVPDPPSTIDELLDPSWKKRVGYAPSNASFQSFVTALRVLRGEDGARDWLTAFAANEPVAYEANGPIRDAVNAAEIDLGLVNHYYLYEAIAEQGADNIVAKNQFVNEDPGGVINVAGVGILKTSDHKDAAQQFVDFLLSVTGQEYFANTTFEYPLADGVPAADGIPPLDELNPPTIDLADLDSIAATQELLAETGLLTQ